MGSHTKTNSGGATTPLSPRLALQLAAPHTWPAAIMPVLVAAACALANTGSLDVGMAWLLLLICILMQASVNTFNDYFDFIKGTDTAEDNVEASDSVLVYNDVNPRSALGLAIGFLTVAFLLGLYVIWKAGPVPLVIALIGAVIVVMYSGGKTPLSYLPVGEAVSGIVMGGLIPLASYQVLSGTFTFMALLWATPTIIGVGLIMFLLMRAIGEMMYSDPSQHTFINFITRYLGRGWGKFAGWTYWIVLILTGMTEITAVSTYFVTFFGTFGIDLNAWKWLIELCFLVALTGINLIAVKVFGEAEFWFSMIKITLIVGLIVTAVVMLFLGFSYPATHIEGVDGTVSGATVSLTNITDGFQLAPNGWMNFFMSFQMVFFAYQLIEFVGVTVSETQNPRKVLPKAVNELIMRILIFYVGALVAIMAIVILVYVFQNVVLLCCVYVITRSLIYAI